MEDKIKEIMDMGVDEKLSMLTYYMLKETEKSLWNKPLTQDWDNYIMDSGLVGPPGAHSRENIIDKIKEFMQLQEDGKDGDYGLKLPKLSKLEIMQIINDICDNNKDPNYIEGEDYVSLEAFKESIKKAAQAAKVIVKEGSLLFIGTGHSESLAPAYSYMGKLLVERGARLYSPTIYPFIVDGREMWLGNLNNVTVLFGSVGVKHTHEDFKIEEILKKEGVSPDLVLADHGFAAAFIRESIPTIAIVDTNDIELLVAADTYPDRIFPIPIHDNNGIEASMAMAYYFEYLLNND